VSKFGRDFQVRTASALVMAPIALLAIYLGGAALYALFLLIAVLCAFEWQNLLTPGQKNLVIASVTGVLCAGFLITCKPVLLASAPLLVAAAAIFYMMKKSKSQRPWLGAVGPLYIGAAFFGFYALSTQINTLIFVLLAVWATDIGAYFAGRLIGGPKLAPRISPGKTWAGFWGGMVAAATFATLWAAYVGVASLAIAASVAAFLAATAQAGDLMESALKRACNAKDSSRLIPGHGGVLDRVDGFLLAAPVFFIFQWLVGAHLAWW